MKTLDLMKYNSLLTLLLGVIASYLLHSPIRNFYIIKNRFSYFFFTTESIE